MPWLCTCLACRDARQRERQEAEDDRIAREFHRRLYAGEVTLSKSDGKGFERWSEAMTKAFERYGQNPGDAT